tara:strand:- start:266 stop:931 length:666 start_codon:yes stop_codon:yes gene_type:complete
MIKTEISQELLDILTPYSDWFFKQDLSELDKLALEHPNYPKEHDLEYYCSDNYLKEIVDKDGEHEGYPEVSYAYDLNMGKHGEAFNSKYEEITEEVISFTGAAYQAVHVYYPKGGFMGWHNNWNASGYNILLSYTEKGTGFFKYRKPHLDRTINDVVHMQDPGGWCCKVGYYGRGREPEKVYYHCAGTYEPRLTFGFVIPHLDMWRNMVEDISGEDAEHLS